MNLSLTGYLGLIVAFAVVAWLTRLLANRLARSAPAWRIWTYVLVAVVPLYQAIDVVVKYGAPWRNPFWYFWVFYLLFCCGMAYASWRRTKP